MSLSSIVIRADAAPLAVGSTFVTLPTSTPAMRTGELGLMLLDELNAAVISKWLRNGIDLVKPR